MPGDKPLKPGEFIVKTPSGVTVVRKGENRVKKMRKTKKANDLKRRMLRQDQLK